MSVRLHYRKKGFRNRFTAAHGASARPFQPVPLSESEATLLTRGRLNYEAIGPCVHGLPDMFKVIVDLSFRVLNSADICRAVLGCTSKREAILWRMVSILSTGTNGSLILSLTLPFMLGLPLGETFIISQISSEPQL